MLEDRAAVDRDQAQSEGMDPPYENQQRQMQSPASRKNSLQVGD